MDNLNDLKAIWRSADTSALPDTAEMKLIINKHRINKLFKTGLLVAVALILAGIMAIAAFSLPKAMLSTYIGEACLILSCLILVVTNLSTINRFYKNKDLNNREFIVFLEHTRVRRHFYHTKTQVLGLTLSSAGLLLYFYEWVYRVPVMGIVFYAISITYMLLVWLVLRPRMFKKQAVKLDAMIEKMEKLAKQNKDE